MPGMIIGLILPWPPSVNHYWRRVVMGGRVATLISKAGREYKKAVAVEVGKRLPAHCRLAGRLAVEVVLVAPDRRARDIDNSLKALLDAMTEAGVWHDDSQIDQITLVRGPVASPGQARVSVRVLDDQLRLDVA
ncbi:endodeoxyribonuclease RusA [Desulfovibrio sp. X2]|uniref:RusA family crossover junction endodeoxyribonuclease n=1 Tax=Desulfovibrio sp. X2 TaxID=941449 RepID=UPI000358C8D6|nr:RusA family crossover junction endodeoxyribonuclease [Desulfovibrio sp. X2]EPR42707.1 endodeoxyribonuclease RusA [Desulfovibrio sp. X2]